MTIEEIETFKNTIVDTIMPHANNMNLEQIQNIIKMVLKENEELPPTFGDMLYEQILTMKK